MRRLLQAILAIAILVAAFTYVYAATTDKNFKMARDINQKEMQTATHLTFQDAHATPKISGGVTNQTATTITVPTGAVAFVFQTDKSVKVGDNSTLDGSGTGKGYRTVAANTQFSYPCANETLIYLAKVTDNYALEFHFEIVRSQD